MAKSSVPLGGETLLARALRATGGRPTVVVGPSDLRASVPFGVWVTRERPPFSGPAAAIAAGMRELEHRSVRAAWILVLACDIARAPEAATYLLAQHDPGRTGRTGRTDDGTVLTDLSGHPQWLCGVYRATTLRAATTGTTLDSVPARALFADMTLTFLPDPDHLAADIDTPADLAFLRARVARERAEPTEGVECLARTEWVDRIAR